MLREKNFTLIEVVVVLVIIMLITGIAVASLRSESPAMAMNRNTLELEAYLARVRFLCSESGRDYVIRFYPDQKMLCAHIDYSEEELLNMEKNITEGSLSQRHTFGDEVEFSTVEDAEETANETNDQDYVEIFRFFPSGGASCVNRPVIMIGEISRVFDVSFFSGQVVYEDGDGSNVEEKKIYAD